MTLRERAIKAWETGSARMDKERDVKLQAEALTLRERCKEVFDIDVEPTLAHYGVYAWYEGMKLTIDDDRPPKFIRIQIVCPECQRVHRLGTNTLEGLGMLIESVDDCDHM